MTWGKEVASNGVVSRSFSLREETRERVRTAVLTAAGVEPGHDQWQADAFLFRATVACLKARHLARIEAMKGGPRVVYDRLMRLATQLDELAQTADPWMLQMLQDFDSPGCVAWAKQEADVARRAAAVVKSTIRRGRPSNTAGAQWLALQARYWWQEITGAKAGYREGSHFRGVLELLLPEAEIHVSDVGQLIRDLKPTSPAE